MTRIRIELRQLALAGTVVIAATILLPALSDSTKEIHGLVGPKAPEGMLIQELGSITLGQEFPHIADAANYVMRGRYVMVDSGGIVPIHSHKNRPANTYVIQGEIIEHRSDQNEPVIRRAGDYTIDDDGIAQWWKNKTDGQVTMFVVDFFDSTKTADH